VASRKPVAPPAPATKPARQSRLWNAGGPAALAALERRDAEERQPTAPRIPGAGRGTRSPALRDPSRSRSRILISIVRAPAAIDRAGCAGKRAPSPNSSLLTTRVLG
jgi:hypothetical protein